MVTINFHVDAFVTVGIDNDCDYDNLQDAYLDADLNIRATNEVSFTDSFEINKPKIITGGYDSCSDAKNNELGSLKSKWNGQNNGTTVQINGNQPFTSLVAINNFEILNGENIVFAGAGGISIKGDSSVLLTNVDVYNNEGNEGGGIRVTGSDARLTITATRIFENQATGFGAGVYCESGAVFNMLGDTAIHNNVATINGGGIFGNNDCQLDVRSGDTESNINTNLGIYANTAVSGGGVYLQGGADMLLTGNDEHPAGVVFNLSTAEDGAGGGGIYMTGQGTTLNATNAKIESNVANTFGGGFVVENFAELKMQRNSTNCWNNDQCSSLSQNFIVTETGEGAAGYISTSAVADIGQSFLSGNQANFGTLFTVALGGSLRLESNLMVNNGPINNQVAEDLFSVFGVNQLGAQIELIYNTITANNAESIFYLDSSFTEVHINIFNSIIWQPGDMYVIEGLDPISQVSCSVVKEPESLVGNIGLVSTQNPRFKNTALNDFHLLGDSSAVDLCDETLFNSQYDDLNAQVRGVDTINVVDNFGPYDAGAYEYLGQNNDIIFHSDFD